MFNIKKYVIKHLLIIPCIVLSFPAIQSADEKPYVNLRPYYKELSVSQVHELPHIAIREKNKWGFIGHSTIAHEYNVKTINNDRVVEDYATGLMWHQSGSDKCMNWKRAQKWIEVLNAKRYAGYNDWRLPTLEEAASLLEVDKKDSGLYIDPVFDSKQWSIWTRDSHISEHSLSLDGAWRVSFHDGIVRWSSNSIDIFSVRPVRTGS